MANNDWPNGSLLTTDIMIPSGRDGSPHGLHLIAWYLDEDKTINMRAWIRDPSDLFTNAQEISKLGFSVTLHDRILRVPESEVLQALAVAATELLIKLYIELDVREMVENLQEIYYGMTGGYFEYTTQKGNI